MNEPIDNESTTDRIHHNGRQSNGHQGWYTDAKEVLTNEVLIGDVAEQRLTLKARGEEVRELNYVLGHSQREIRRLTSQAALLRPITERLLRNVKIGPGMRVLDLGCGAGDVSFLAAELVGSTGSVVGIDRNQEVLAVAAERARVAGLRQISFQEASLESFSSGEPFDLVIGRYILIHQSDPVGFLRAAARLVKPGGCIAFHEIRLVQMFGSLPPVPLWQVTGNFIQMACQSALLHYDVSNRLIDSFFKAGLPRPDLFCETLVGGGIDSPLYAWVAETLQSFLPQLAKMGIVAGELVGIETLESRLREAVVEARSQVVAPGQVCAWART
jgi:ubiquinone/menaquinone biosynthesis C-methylase UbiE